MTIPSTAAAAAASVAAKAFLPPIFLPWFLMNILFGYQQPATNFLTAFLPILGAITLLTFVRLYFKHDSDAFLVSVILLTLALSVVFSIGLNLAVVHFSETDPFYHILGLYLMTLSAFHAGEFEITAWANPSSVTVESFLLNHSLEYYAALAISLAEFLLESWWLPQCKFILHPWLTYTGLAICLSGDAVRKIAMYTAGRNFNHVIQVDYQTDHTLITTGIYAIARHPSYMGWFYWSLGTQFLLHNPISLVGYTIVSWRFFNERILFEEITLINFFGPKYLQYKKQVPSGLPWINGYEY